MTRPSASLVRGKDERKADTIGANTINTNTRYPVLLRQALTGGFLTIQEPDRKTMFDFHGDATNFCVSEWRWTNPNSMT